MWKAEAPKQAQISDADIRVTDYVAVDDLTCQWQINTRFGQQQTQTRITALRWDDLVRQWWLKGEYQSMAAVPVWVFRLLRHGIYGLTGRRARPMFISLITPPVVLAGILGLIAGLLWVAALLHPYLLLLALPLALWLAPRLWRLADRSIGSGWLNQCLHYFGRNGTSPLPEQEARCAVFAQRLIAACEDSDVDEVVLVGFSLGAAQAVRTMAMALRQKADLGQGRVKVSLLTMGQCYSVYARMPGDPDFNRAREDVARATAIHWADATSASDPASACRIGPLDGMEDVREGRLSLHAPRFHKVLTPERFRAIRRNPLDFHFQYFRSVDLEGGYNWFSMVAGPLPLSRQGARP